MCLSLLSRAHSPIRARRRRPDPRLTRPRAGLRPHSCSYPSDRCPALSLPLAAASVATAAQPRRCPHPQREGRGGRLRRRLPHCPALTLATAALLSPSL